MLSDRIFAAVAVLVVCFGPTVPGDEVSRQAPPIYQEKLSALITPLDKIQGVPSSLDLKDEDGVVLLNEKIHYLDDTGRRYMVFHSISKALNESGAKSNGEDSWTYRKANQKIHLLLARTVLPDGTEIPVSPSAAILQSPQRQADYSLYDDEGELKVIFSNVKPGTITESIVLIEESSFRIPGEFIATVSQAFDWPVQQMRFFCEMPDAMARRLKITPLGEGVGKAAKEAPVDGRVRWTWVKNDIAARPHEVNRTPLWQTGPLVWLTTLPDWDAFVQWYAPLVEERDQLSPELAKQVDDWTKDASSPGEVLDILMRKVARDVRYVGLEFGNGDLQPHDCNAVWKNQYGDCKDKANLLCAMLRHKKINAYLALINTDNKGRVERRSTDYRQFTHAITAVELQPGQRIFCDPTIAFGKPGLLSPGDTDRDVLVIRKPSAEWARTPKQDAGTLHYDLELQLGNDGALSGWITQHNEGYYGASAAEEFSRLEKNDLRQRAADFVRAFYKGAEIIDVTKTSLEKWNGTYEVKAYFVLPASRQDHQETQTISFPKAELLFIDPGAQKKRKTPYYLWADTVKVNSRIKLPEGTVPQELPRPYKLESPALDTTAQWATRERECQATLTIHTKTDLVPREEFETLFNALLSIHTWLDKPLTLVGGGEKTEPSSESEITLESFPMMPSGEGQMQLVDQRFPADANAALRREALRKTMQYFPSDKPTLFKAGVKLALLDWNEDKNDAAAEAIGKLLKSYRNDVGKEDAAWGDYLLARIFTDLKKNDEAEKMYQRLAADQTLSPYRRAWADNQRAQLLEKKDRTAAIRAIREAVALESSARPDSFALLAKLLILDGQMPELKKEIETLLSRKPPEYEAMLAELTEQVGNGLLPKEKAGERDQLLQILDGAGQSNDLGKRFSKSLQTAHTNVRAAGAASRIVNSLKQYLASHPLDKLDATAARFKTRDEFLHAIDAAQNARKPEVCLRYRMELLTAFEPDADFPNALWRAAEDADWFERFYEKPEPLLSELLDLCDQLPPDNDAYFDGRFLRAKGCARHGAIDSARKIHQELVDNLSLPAGFRITALVRLADNLETLKTYDKALAIYKRVEAEIDYNTAKDALLRAALLNLELGHREEALRIFTLLSKQRPGDLAKAKTAWQTKELLALIQNKQTPPAYWDTAAKWWPAWQKLAAKLGASKENGPIVAAFTDIGDFNDELQAAERTNDRHGYLEHLETIAHGARWEPSFARDLCRLTTFNTSKLWPDQANALREFSLAVYDNYTADDPELRRCMQLYTAVNTFDSDQTAKCLQVIHAFYDAAPPEDSISEAMARIWACAAEREASELAPATANLEKLLSSSRKLDDRAKTVARLAVLYENADRTADEETLLQRELKNPESKTNSAEYSKLSSRYELLVKAGNESKEFQKAIDGWLQKKKPAWYDFAEPKSLDDSRLSNLDPVLKDPQRIFTSPEIIKLQLLVAASPEQPLERRKQQFANAVLSLIDSVQTQAEAREIVESILNDKQFPESVRLQSLWFALINARCEENAAHVAELMKHPLYGQLSDEVKAACALFKEMLAVDHKSPQAVRGKCEALLKNELSYTALNEFRKLYQHLLSSHQFDSAEAVYKELANVRLNANAQTTKAALQMECLKSLTKARKWAPCTKAMRDLVLAAFPDIRKPIAYSVLQNLDRLALDEETNTAIRLYRIKAEQFDPADFSFWTAFVQDLPRTEANKKLTFALIDTALQNAPGDSDKAAAWSFATSVTDTDDPAVREELASLYKTYRNPEKYPLTYAAIRLYEIHTAWRGGQAIDAQSELANVKLPTLNGYINRLKLRYLVLSGDQSRLRKAIEESNPDDLLSDFNIDISLKAFDILGLTEELALAKDAARKSVYRNLLTGWATLDHSAIIRAYNTANALDDASAIPETCFKDVLSKIKNRQQTAFLATTDARLRKDWPRLLAASDKAIPQWPTFYHLYWYRAAALYHLGKTKDALEPLRTYVRYSHDESDYPEAAEWLQKLMPSDASNPNKTPQSAPGQADR